MNNSTGYYFFTDAEVKTFVNMVERQKSEEEACVLVIYRILGLIFLVTSASSYTFLFSKSWFPYLSYWHSDIGFSNFRCK